MIGDDPPVIPGVGVEQPHVVHQLVSDDPHRVSVRGVEAGQDPHAARETWQEDYVFRLSSLHEVKQCSSWLNILSNAKAIS